MTNSQISDGNQLFRDEVCVILRKPVSGTYLIIKSKGFHGSNVSGGVEPEDQGDRDQAAMREVYEEVGLKLSIDTKNHLICILHDTSGQSLTHLYLVDVDETCQISPNPQEVFGYEWMTLDRVIRNRPVIRAHHVDRIIMAANRAQTCHEIELTLEHKDRSRQKFDLPSNYQFAP